MSLRLLHEPGARSFLQQHHAGAPSLPGSAMCPTWRCAVCGAECAVVVRGQGVSERGGCTRAWQPGVLMVPGPKGGVFGSCRRTVYAYCCQVGHRCCASSRSRGGVRLWPPCWMVATARGPGMCMRPECSPCRHRCMGMCCHLLCAYQEGGGTVVIIIRHNPHHGLPGPTSCHVGATAGPALYHPPATKAGDTYALLHGCPAAAIAVAAPAHCQPGLCRNLWHNCAHQLHC